MDSTWMKDGRFKIHEFCMYEQWIRTNNPTEGMNKIQQKEFGKHPNYDKWADLLAN